MEVSDPFTPAYQSDNGIHVDLPEHWMTPFPSEEQGTPEPATSFGSVEPLPAPAVTEAPSRGDLNRARQIAERLTDDLKELQGSLDASEAERESWSADRDRMKEQIRHLEGEADEKRKFTEALTSGAGGSLSADDLTALQGLTDALTQDPDRLTVLFNVVQQASKLATVVAVYSEVRRLAEGA